MIMIMYMIMMHHLGLVSVNLSILLSFCIVTVFGLVDWFEFLGFRAR